MKTKTIYISIAIILGVAIFIISELTRGESGYFGEMIFVDTPSEQRAFNQKEWAIKTGDGYPFRPVMIDDVLYNKEIRALTKDSLLMVLGRPDREENNHLYYLIDQKRIGFWPMNTKTMVVKINETSTIEWIKIHQ